MKSLTILLLVTSTVSFATGSAFASLSYDFDVRTSTISGPGYLELQFNPGGGSLDANGSIPPASAATAEITNFSITNGTLGTVFPTAGDVTGSLPAITINNTTQWNDYFQAVTFGSLVHFSLNLSGATTGSTFGLSFFKDNDDATALIPLLTSDLTNGFATSLDFNQDGVTRNDFSNGLVTVSDPPAPAPTPIPAAAWLLGSGLLGLVGIRRRKMDTEPSRSLASQMHTP